MKTRFLFLLSLILALGFYSCSSDDIIDSPQVEPEAKMQFVTFNLEEFKDVSNLRSTSDEYSIAYLVYRTSPYDLDDKALEKHKIIKSSEAKTIKDTLSVSDNYTIVMIATNSEIPETNLEFSDISSYKKVNISLKNYQSDVLFTSFDLSVGIEPIQQNVTLDRIVSKIDITVEDPLDYPENLLRIDVNTHSKLKPAVFCIADQATKELYDSQPFVTFTKDEVVNGGLNDIPNFYIFQTKKVVDQRKYNLNIDIMKEESFPLGGSGLNVIYERIIKENLTLEGNQVLKLSGKLFENRQETNINLSTEWGEIISESFYVAQ